jgi:L-methionine (R)-S-oxide reductase
LKRILAARQVLAHVDRVLAQKLSAHVVARGKPLDDVVDILCQHRGYFWIGVYLVVGNKAVRQAFRGPVPPCHTFELGKGNVGTAGQTGVTKVVPDVTKDPVYSVCFAETKSEIVVPIKIAGRVLGVIDVESDEVNAFGEEDRVLLKEVAARLARFLTSRGKVLIRHLRESENPAPLALRAEFRGYLPASEKAAGLRAAAGESRRT